MRVMGGYFMTAGREFLPLREQFLAPKALVPLDLGRARSMLFFQQ
jgi:hypothetical protein